jgi:acetyl-CoA acetyltransferase
MTALGKVLDRTPSQFAAQAITLAVEDAGLTLDDVDGLLVSEGMSGGIGLGLQRQLGLQNLRLLSQVQGFGSTAVAMVSYAAMAVAAGSASVIGCVFADAPLRRESGSQYGELRPLSGWSSYEQAIGLTGANPRYALAARRHMETFGTTSEEFGAVAVAQRAWAAGNPVARWTEPITIDDHQASRWIAEPLHLLDCCLVSNGGIAVLVTSADRARHLRQPPVYVWGWGQGHPGYRPGPGSSFGLTSGAALSGPAAMAMAGVGPKDVDICEIYDCYTYTVVISLEDYGFVAKGEGGPFVATGALGPGGTLPTNTGGGQLSSYYLWGMTPLSEAVIQARGHGGARQCTPNDVILVSGNGGILDYHSTVILSSHEPSKR